MIASRLLVPIALLLALSAQAGPVTIAVAPLQGKPSQVCTKAVAEVAREYGTVEPWKSATKERPPTTWEALSSWLGARGNEIGADVLLLGVVQGQRLILEAYDPRRVRLIGLKRLITPKLCRFTPTSKALIGEWLKRVIELRNEPEAAPEIAERIEPPADLLGGEPPGKPKPEVEVGAASKRSAEASAEAARPYVRPEARSLISVAGELAIVGRSFSYDSPRTPHLRSYDIAGMLTPGVRIEARPLAEEDPRLAPIFVTAFLRQAIGVKSARPDGGPAHPTEFLDAGAYAGYRFELPRTALAISPRAGLRRTEFRLKPARDGVRETDLPDVAYSCLEVGADGDYPLKDWVAISVSASYLLMLSGGQVFSREYFSGGSDLAFDLSAGLRFLATPEISATVSGGYQRFSLHFDAVPGATRSASGAEDGLLGLRAVVRVDF